MATTNYEIQTHDAILEAIMHAFVAMNNAKKCLTTRKSADECDTIVDDALIPVIKTLKDIERKFKDNAKIMELVKDIRSVHLKIGYKSSTAITKNEITDTIRDMDECIKLYRKITEAVYDDSKKSGGSRKRTHRKHKKAHRTRKHRKHHK